ncbi:MAG: hypothetical protein JXR94_12105 [Candidatus Hydrogenedentes bacterium]|nr:hypothetical protein [Candidatus Hydrogenedentota bacterium]
MNHTTIRRVAGRAGGHPRSAAIAAVALLLAALFTLAAVHGLFVVLLGLDHLHDHATCPLCTLIHTPILVAVCAILLVRLARLDGRVSSATDAPDVAPIPSKLLARAPPSA